MILYHMFDVSLRDNVTFRRLEVFYTPTHVGCEEGYIGYYATARYSEISLQGRLYYLGTF